MRVSCFWSSRTVLSPWYSLRINAYISYHHWLIWIVIFVIWAFWMAFRCYFTIITTGRLLLSLRKKRYFLDGLIWRVNTTLMTFVCIMLLIRAVASVTEVEFNVRIDKVRIRKTQVLYNTIGLLSKSMMSVSLWYPTSVKMRVPMMMSMNIFSVNVLAMILREKFSSKMNMIFRTGIISDYRLRRIRQQTLTRLANVILMMKLTVVRIVPDNLGIRIHDRRVIYHLLTSDYTYLRRISRRVKLDVTLLIASDMRIIRNLSIAWLLIINGGDSTRIISSYTGRLISRMRWSINWWDTSIERKVPSTITSMLEVQMMRVAFMRLIKIVIVILLAIMVLTR